MGGTKGGNIARREEGRNPAKKPGSGRIYGDTNIG